MHHKIDDEHEYSLPDKPTDLSDDIESMWTRTRKLHRFLRQRLSVMRFWTIKQADTDDVKDENDKMRRLNKETVEALGVLG